MNIPYVQIKEIVDLNTYKLEIMYQPPTMNIPKEKEDLIIRNDSNIKINMSICTTGGYNFFYLNVWHVTHYHVLFMDGAVVIVW
jgi:hypothetical protein